MTEGVPLAATTGAAQLVGILSRPMDWEEALRTQKTCETDTHPISMETRNVLV